MAAEQLRDVGDATVSEFECLVGSVQATLAFVEGVIGEPHRLLDVGGIRAVHEGLLRKKNDSKLLSLSPKSRAKKAKWDS